MARELDPFVPPREELAVTPARLAGALRVPWSKLFARP